MARDFVDQAPERVNNEIDRGSNVVDIFPDEAAVVRLTGGVLPEVRDEWQISDRCYLCEALLSDDGLPLLRPLRHVRLRA